MPYTSHIKKKFRIGRIGEKGKITFKRQTDICDIQQGPCGDYFDTEDQAMQAIEKYAEKCIAEQDWVDTVFVIVPAIEFRVNDLGW